MARPQVSVLKRQREQQRRERLQAKAERRAQRKLTGKDETDIDSEVVREQPETGE
jgi:hypothetical protein